MANEAKAHELCQAAGALVPEVVYFEEDNMVLGRSLMVTRDMGGACIENIGGGVLSGLMVEVGRNLAKINSISVPGIGYIDKEVGNGFVGSGKKYNDFVLEDIGEKIAQLAKLGILEKEIAESAAEFVRQNTKMMLEYRDGWLAHGDFDMTHVFAENGKLTGFIDFGDIRAASRYHDLAHFYMYSPEYFDDLIKEGIVKKQAKVDIDRLLEVDKKRREILVDQGHGAMLELSRGLAFGVNVGGLLKLQGALQRNGKIKAAGNEQEMFAGGE